MTACTESHLPEGFDLEVERMPARRQTHRSPSMTAALDGGYLRLSHSANNGSSKNGVPSSFRWT
jgi:hypothetical protein